MPANAPGHGPTAPAFSESEFRAALGMFATGVTIVTARTPEGKLVGLTAYAFVWTLTARAALRQSTPFHQGKVATARFFFARLLPQSLGLAASIRNGAASPLPLF